MEDHLIQADIVSSAESTPMDGLSLKGQDTSPSTQGCPEVAASVLLGQRFGPKFTFWKNEKEDRKVYCQWKKETNEHKKSPNTKPKTTRKGLKAVVVLLLQYGVCFSPFPFPEVSCLPRHALLPLLPPAGHAHCSPVRQIHHPKSVSVQFLLLAAQEGVLFALPKCSQGLMLRCYVQTISAVMNHVLPPLCFYFCTRLSFLLSSKHVWVSVFATGTVHAGYMAQAELFLLSHCCWDW